MKKTNYQRKDAETQRKTGSLTIFAKGIFTYSSDGAYPSDGDSHRTGTLQKLSKNGKIFHEHHSWTWITISQLVLFSLVFSLFTACKNDPSTNQPKVITLPKTPEEVCRTWQQYVDNNEIAKAMLLGSPSAKEWLKMNQSLFLADDELEPTQFISIRCTETGDQAICKYSLKEEGDTIEDYFSLVKINQQWLIHIEEQDGTDPNEAIFEEMKKSLKLD